MTQNIQAGDIQSFDEDKRELTVRLVPWGVDALTSRGYERFEKGAFDGIDPSRFVSRQRHQDPPTGRATELWADDEWQYARIKVAKTIAGDEQLTLAKDGVETGISVGFEDGRFSIGKAEDGRKRITHQSVNPSGMLEISTTYIPAFRDAAVLQIRERESMTDQEQAAEVPAVTDYTPTPAVTQVSPTMIQELQERLFSRIDRLEEKQAAMLLNAPSEGGDNKAQLKREVVLNIRELADVITTGNEGVVPDSQTSEMLGRIDTGRPFLNSTRRVNAPTAGTRLIFPKITQTPLVELQESEKAELASRATAITTVDYPMETHGGAADLSMQLIKRSSPEFLSLFLELLGEAYAQDTEDAAIDALLAEAAVEEGGALDVDAPQFGAAFTNAATATGRTMKPDRIWLSTAAMAKFINALEPAGGGGRPLYPGLAAISGLGAPSQSLGGAEFNLQAIWTPELDDETPDVIVGPSRAFVWAEDGTYTLQADVPSKFGRDVGLAGMIWYAPIYPAAFTSYTLAP